MPLFSSLFFLQSFARATHIIRGKLFVQATVEKNAVYFAGTARALVILSDLFFLGK